MVLTSSLLMDFSMSLFFCQFLHNVYLFVYYLCLIYKCLFIYLCLHDNLTSIIIKYPCLLLIILLLLKPNINIKQSLFILVCILYISPFFYLQDLRIITFKVHSLQTVCSRVLTVLIQSDSLCLLIIVIRPFILNGIISMFEFRFTISLSAFYFFLFCSSAFFSFFKWAKLVIYYSILNPLLARQLCFFALAFSSYSRDYNITL